MTSWAEGALQKIAGARITPRGPEQYQGEE
jgi:hypothetical protein